MFDGTIVEEETATTRQSTAQKQVHLFLQSNGGVGKTFAAWLYAQHLRKQDSDVAVIDADPVNTGLSRFPGLRVRRLETMEGLSINRRRFDGLIHMLLTEDKHFIIDIGPCGFLPLLSYLAENEVLEMIHGAGKKVVAHSILVGGGRLNGTLSDFAFLVSALPPHVKVILWRNEFFGPVQLPDGGHIEETEAFVANEDRIAAELVLDCGHSCHDVRQALELFLTFSEASGSDQFTTVAKVRLSHFERSIAQQLSAVDRSLCSGSRHRLVDAPPVKPRFSYNPSDGESLIRRATP